MTDKLPEKGIQSDALNARLRDLLLNRAAVGAASSDGRSGGNVSISCSLCGKVFSVSHDKVGRSGICPKCGRRIDFESRSEQQPAEMNEFELAPNPFDPEPTFEAEQPPHVVREAILEPTYDEGTFTPVAETVETPDFFAPPIPSNIENGSRSWPTVVPDAVPSAIPAPPSSLTGDEEILELPSIEEDSEPIFEMDIEDSAAIWLDIEDEEDS